MKASKTRVPDPSVSAIPVVVGSLCNSFVPEATAQHNSGLYIQQAPQHPVTFEETIVTSASDQPETVTSPIVDITCSQSLLPQVPLSVKSAEVNAMDKHAQEQEFQEMIRLELQSVPPLGSVLVDNETPLIDVEVVEVTHDFEDESSEGVLIYYYC